MAGKKPARRTRRLPRPISDHLLRHVARVAATIKTEVGLLFFGSTNRPSASLDALRLCRELALANPVIRLRVYDESSDGARCRELGVSFFPAVLIAGRNRGAMRFHGVPGGYSLQSLAEALRAASEGASGLEPSAAARLRSLRVPLRLRVFVHGASPVCARLSSLALRLAVESELVSTGVFSAPDFPELCEKYGVESTPRTFVNERAEIQGAPAEGDFIEALLGAQVPRPDAYG